jgi:hypothetical protein
VIVGGGDLVESNARCLGNLHATSERSALDHRHPRLVEIREVVGHELQERDCGSIPLLKSFRFGGLR